MLRHSCRGRDFSGDGEHKFSSKMENARYFPMNLDLEEDVHYCIQRRASERLPNMSNVPKNTVS